MFWDSVLVQVSVLGPLAVRDDGADVPVPGRLVRRLLVRLAVAAPAPVPVSGLLAALWPDGAAPADATNALQSLVSRLRRALGRSDAVRVGPAGYSLDVPAGAVDLHRLDQGAAHGRRQLIAGKLAEAEFTLTAARAEFHGEPLVEAADADWARGETARLEQLQLDVLADLVEVKLRLGRGGEVIGELELLVGAHPLREDFCRQLMTALAAAGRGAEALAAYERLRARLADELGVDPGPEIRKLHLELLRGDAGPARASRRSNLRSFLTSFVGRTAELDRLARLLAEHRLVTIVGPGGAGKTRIAVHAAERAEPPADGVWLIELAPVTGPDSVPAAILEVLGSVGGPLTVRLAEPRMGGLDPRERVVDLLGQADIVLVLDNCEHLLEPTAELVGDVLARCPGVRILATSREPLGILGEAMCSLPPLGLPPEDVSVADALRSPAVTLLVERAAASADFAVTESNLAAVVSIVRRLDGLPLAIELAAARLRVLPVETVAERLSDRFRLLAGGNRVALPRHRTLRAVVEWSWDLLSEPERRLAERLAVFPAGATAVSAAAICADALVDAADVADLLVSLADKSLLQVVDAAGEPRFRMLETIREYGIERLSERGEVQAVRETHAEWFTRLAVDLDPVLRTRDQMSAVQVLRAERDNFLAALRYLADTGRTDRTVTLALALCWYWVMIDAGGEALPWLDVALTASAESDDPRRALLMAARAVQSMTIDDDQWVAQDGSGWDRWRLELAASLRRVDEVEEQLSGTPLYSIVRTLLAYFSGDADRGDALVDRLVDGDQWTRAAALTMKAAFAENSGRIEVMREVVGQAHALFTQIGDRWGLTATFENRSHLRTLDGDLDGALTDLQAALDHATELGADSENMFLRLRMSDLELRLGHVERAREQLDRARQPGHGRPSSSSREMIVMGATAAVLQAEGRPVEAMAIVRDLRKRTRSRPGAPALFGHLAAMLSAIAAHIEVLNGEIEMARLDLEYGYPEAVETGDAPILASMGVAVAAYAQARSRPADAAEILGAAARLRGGDDGSDIRIDQLTRDLRAQLPDFDHLYRSGRAMDRAAATARVDPASLQP